MAEISIALIIFAIWTTFSIVYYNRYTKFQLNDDNKKGNIWNNTYIFDIIPSVFPTLGIFCTALGITIGIWNFNASDINGSLPELLGGLKLAFIATMAGIIGADRRNKYIWNPSKSYFEITQHFDWGNFISYAKKAQKIKFPNKVKSQTKRHWNKLEKLLKI